MIITNPPFSLLREFVAWCVEGKVDYAVIGNVNAVTYKDIFSLIQENKVWIGATGNTADMAFEVPLWVEVRERDKDKAARMGYVTTPERKFTRLGNSCWFATLKHKRREVPLALHSMENNLRNNTRIINNPYSYRKYDNHDAIEVPVVSGIPSDWKGMMGVPISFLPKYCPQQHRILSFRHGYDGKDLGFIDDDGTWRTPYFRIIIAKK